MFLSLSRAVARHNHSRKTKQLISWLTAPVSGSMTTGGHKTASTRLRIRPHSRIRTSLLIRCRIRPRTCADPAVHGRARSLSDSGPAAPFCRDLSTPNSIRHPARVRNMRRAGRSAASGALGESLVRDNGHVYRPLCTRGSKVELWALP
jgi:hypothetical protein